MNIVTITDAKKMRISNICDAIPVGWHDFFKNNRKMLEVIDKTLEKSDFIPNPGIMFAAFRFTPLRSIKIVIIGQDPYPNESNCSGLAFSSNTDGIIPASLKNIFNNLVDNKLMRFPSNGNLESWALQGVFLINTALTCERGESGSHEKVWADFTKELFLELSKRPNLIYFAFGAQVHVKNIDRKKNIIFETSHPSPMSFYRGFSTSNCFGLANEELIKMGKKPINWNL